MQFRFLKSALKDAKVIVWIQFVGCAECVRVRFFSKEYQEKAVRNICFKITKLQIVKYQKQKETLNKTIKIRKSIITMYQLNKYIKSKLYI